MVMELDVSVIVLSISSASGSPFPPRGPLGRFPRFVGTTSCSDVRRPSRVVEPTALVAALRFLRLALPPRSVEAADSPRFLENPHARAVFFDPDRIASQAIRDMPYSSARHCCLPSPLRRRLLPFLALRGSIARLVRSLSTLRRPGLPRSRRKTRFRLVAHLGRSGFQPAGFRREVSVVFSTSRSPHPGLAWRTEAGKGTVRHAADVVVGGEVGPGCGRLGRAAPDGSRILSDADTDSGRDSDCAGLLGRCHISWRGRRKTSRRSFTFGNASAPASSSACDVRHLSSRPSARRTFRALWC